MRTGAVRSAQSAAADRRLGGDLNQAHGAVRANRTVRRGDHLRGGAGAVQWTLVLVLRNRRLPGGRGGLGSETHRSRRGRPAPMTLVKIAPPLEQDVDLSKTYDAVIVGSGAAGGMAAHVLTTHGLKEIGRASCRER